MKQNYINHVVLVLDKSYSMTPRKADVVQVADNQIAHLAARSKELDQETRVTVYTFDDTIECLFYDKDVLRMPSMQGLYRPAGNTALIEATLKAIEDLSKTPELYGDHAFLVYVLTDGQENQSKASSYTLEAKIKALPENWTIAAFVPNQNGKFEAKKFGFPSDNIAIWDTSAKDLSEVGETIRTATDNFMTQRTTGVRGSKNLFSMAPVAKSVVAASMPKLHPGQYRMLDVKAVGRIDEFDEEHTRRAYQLGEAFYQLSKTEKIQPAKKVALYDKKTRGVYVGWEARKLLGLPDHEVKVGPTDLADFEIFVQSTSVNRKLVPGTRVLLVS